MNIAKAIITIIIIIIIIITTERIRAIKRVKVYRIMWKEDVMISRNCFKARKEFEQLKALFDLSRGEEETEGRFIPNKSRLTDRGLNMLQCTVLPYILTG
jgi:hypothetical protein